MVIGIVPPSALSIQYDMPIELAPATMELNDDGKATPRPIISDTIARLLYAKAERVYIPLNRTTAGWIPQRLQDGIESVGVPVVYTYSERSAFHAINSVFPICTEEDIALVLPAESTYRFPRSTATEVVDAILGDNVDLVICNGSKGGVLLGLSGLARRALHGIGGKRDIALDQWTSAISKLKGSVRVRQILNPNQKPPSFRLPL